MEGIKLIFLKAVPSFIASRASVSYTLSCEERSTAVSLVPSINHGQSVTAGVGTESQKSILVRLVERVVLCVFPPAAPPGDYLSVTEVTSVAFHAP